VSASNDARPEVAVAPGLRRWWPYLAAVVIVLVLDLAAAIVVPPAGYPDILTNLEPIAPHVVYTLVPGSDTFTISATILTEWLVMAVVLVLAFLVVRRLTVVPGRLQSAVEYVYEGFEGFVISLGGAPARRYVPLFLALFLLIIASNWSGLLPLVGKVEFIRAPTSDVNITFGLALVSFVIFHYEGVRVLGLGGYLSKFFNLHGFRESLFDGFVGLLIGLLEFVLEFFKPLTLALRLFANIYGGELVIGVMTALLIAILPLPFIALEVFVGFMQALVFALLTVMFTLIAIEGHGEEAAHPRPAEAPAAEPAHGALPPAVGEGVGA
jgi:F-type H+-transporting ATPase subunit a